MSVQRTKLEEATAFLRTLFPQVDLGVRGYLSLWARQSKISVHLPINNLPAIIEVAQEIEDAKEEVYFGCGLRGSDLGPDKRGGKKDVIIIPGLWGDIDVAGAAHKSNDLPPNRDAVLELLDEFPLPPSMLVDSGFGMHAWWLMEKPWDIRECNMQAQILSNAFQDHLIKLGASKSYHIDNTADLARVLRMPGTKNIKVPGDHRLVTVLLDDSATVRYRPQDLDLRKAKSSVQVAYEATPAGKVGAPSAPPVSGSDEDAAIIRVKNVLLKAKRPETRKLFEKICAGEDFAKKGLRDITLQRAASAIAFVDRTTSPLVLSQIFRASLETMAEEDDDPNNPPMTLDDAARKIERAQYDAKAQHEKDERIRNVLTRVSRFEPPPIGSRGPEDGGPAPPPSSGSGQPLGGGTFSEQPAAGAEAEGVTADSSSSSGVGTAEYTNEEILQFCIDHACTSDELVQRWIIQRATGFFVMVNGKYRSAITKDELDVSLPRDLAPLGNRFNWYTAKADGTQRRKNVQEVLRELATVARNSTADLTIQKSFYDPQTQTFAEAVCPLRNILPVHHPQIQMWLELLGGSDKEKLLDWIATITLLEKQTCALYLSGEPGSGKTMLATGLARLWTEGSPTELAKILDNFNEDLAHCPLIFADETLPQKYRGQHASSELRQIVGSNNRTLSRKYLSNVPIKGALRLMLCANNDRLLALGDEDLGHSDLEAVAGRFLHIETPKVAKMYLDSIGGRKGTEGWVDGDKISQHAKWLALNRVVVMGNRFLVEGHATKMHRQLAVQGKTPELVIEWIARFLSSNHSITNGVIQKGLVRAGDSRLLVNTNGPVEHWSDYVHSEKNPPTTTRIGRALANLSTGTERVGTIRYHVVNVVYVFDWAEKHQIGDIEKMKKIVNDPVKEYKSPQMGIN